MPRGFGFPAAFFWFLPHVTLIPPRSLAEASLSSLLASVRATSSSPRGLRADEGPGPGPGSALLQEELARRRRAMMLFRRQCPAPRGGTLTIAPLTAIHAAFAAELLSETFLVALG